MQCKPCPVNCRCYGGDLIVPAPGYFRISKYSEYSDICYNPDACSGGNRDNLLGVCSTGY